MTRTRRPSAQTTAVVLALAEEPATWRYGYELCQHLGLKAGSVYPILMRLADRGLLETAWERDAPAGRPPRHLYRLTGPGRVLAGRLAAEGVGRYENRWPSRWPANRSQRRSLSNPSSTWATAKQTSSASLSLGLRPGPCLGPNRSSMVTYSAVTRVSRSACTRPPRRSTLLSQRRLSAPSSQLSLLDTLKPIRKQSSSRPRPAARGAGGATSRARPPGRPGSDRRTARPGSAPRTSARRPRRRRPPPRRTAPGPAGPAPGPAQRWRPGRPGTSGCARSGRGRRRPAPWSGRPAPGCPPPRPRSGQTRAPARRLRPPAAPPRRPATAATTRAGRWPPSRSATRAPARPPARAPARRTPRCRRRPQPCPWVQPTSRASGDDRASDLEAKLDGGRARGHDGARSQAVPPHRLNLKAGPRQADELNPALIRQQLGLLTLLEELVTDPQLPALALVPAGILDDQHRADFMAQSEQVDGHAGVQQRRIAGLEQAIEELGLPAVVDRVWVDAAVAGLQLVDSVQLLHELANRCRRHRKLLLEQVGGLTRNERLEHSRGHHVVAAPLRGHRD